VHWQEFSFVFSFALHNSTQKTSVSHTGICLLSLRAMHKSNEGSANFTKMWPYVHESANTKNAEGLCAVIQASYRRDDRSEVFLAVGWWWPNLDKATL
jgi:signal transduction protein with GAF and PtsI domain